MRLLLVLFVLTFAVYDDWATWKQKYNKSYLGQEEEHRYSIWKENREEIIAHNMRGTSWTKGLNKFSDLTLKEFKSKMTCLKSKVNSDLPSDICARIDKIPTNNVLPPVVDWRTQGAVTPVKDQSMCGSCWGFSAIGSLEGIWKVMNGTLYSLSEQQLVDCSWEEGNAGCEGGLMDQAFNYTMQKGACTENDYSYMGMDGPCRDKDCQSVVKTTGCANIWTGNPYVTESILEYMLNLHPMSVAMDASCLMSYEKGVINDTSCYHSLDHGLTLVGYNRSTDVRVEPNYWIVKNSWSSSWGEAGYFRISLGDNMLGIGELPSVATVPGLKDYYRSKGFYLL
jgi:C1A family cysteine protease